SDLTEPTVESTMGMQEDLAVTRTVNLSTVIKRTLLDSDFRYTLFPLFYCVVFVLGLIANSYVLFVLQRMQDTKAMNEIRIYMANLTVTHLFFVCALPFCIGYYHHRGDWRFLCRVTGVFFFINTYCSVLFLAAISVNRYWAITRPLDATSSDHWRRGVAITAVIWALTLSMSMPHFFETGIQVDTGNVSRCFEVLVFFLVVVCNLLIARALLAPVPYPASGLQFIPAPGAVVGVFVVCFLPHRVVQGPWTLAVLEIKEGWGRMDWGQRTIANSSS
uniref:Platelet-activating factor receptor n=1 Tax=Oncorhynchus tshawytscha TaxID=74940 RepID=A0A8C8IEI0_ONCTS